VGELPFETWERVTETKWPGGRRPIVRAFLHLFFIFETPGSAEANLRLQRCLDERMRAM
jgi:hypothetical protein